MIDVDINRMLIDDIGLSVRSRNALRREGIDTVEDLLDQTEETLMGIRNLGVKSVNEILLKIDEYRQILNGLSGSPDGAGNNGSLPVNEEKDDDITKDPAKILIDDIDLSVRSRNALRRAGISTVEDLLDQTEETLLSIRNLGVTSAKEILLKIEEYIQKLNTVSRSPAKYGSDKYKPVIDDVDQWLKDDSNKATAEEWLKERDYAIEELDLLSARAFNLLSFAGYLRVYQFAFLSEEELLSIPRMDMSAAAEIRRHAARFISDNKDDLAAFISEREEKEPYSGILSIYDVLYDDDINDVIKEFVENNDVDIRALDLSTRSHSRLYAYGLRKMSDIVFMTRGDLLRIRSLGLASADEITDKIHEYLDVNGSRILAWMSGDREASLTEDKIKEDILRMYMDHGFEGFSFNEMTEKLGYSDQIGQERIKKIIGRLLADGELKYVDYRCYRIYDSFEKAFAESPDIEDRDKEFVLCRLHGETLEEIANKNGVTRERVRQIVTKAVKKFKNKRSYVDNKGSFDEDYYEYLYETYDFDKKIAAEWLGISEGTWNYFGICGIDRKRRPIDDALEDQKIDLGLRLKIKNYLNRNKLYINGVWIDNNRAEIENYVVRTYCRDEVSFDDFVSIYNGFLQNETDITDSSLLITESVYRTRLSRLSESRVLLWKQNEKLRAYDIDGRDYSELLDTLNLDSYENIELSTEKFIRDYPDVMRRYDIRDRYELHNLLKKIIPDGSYHDLRFSRMPVIRFGVPDRDGAIFDILIDNAPVTTARLAELVSQEYGYDTATIIGSYLKPFALYYDNGIYSIDQKQMSEQKLSLFSEQLTEEFYYLEDIRKIYVENVPGADPEEVNPYNLRRLGFHIFSNYVLRNYPSAEAFFHDVLTREDMIDLRTIKNKFSRVQAYYMKLNQLKKDLDVIEFEPDQIINFRVLDRKGITKDFIRDFCDSVFEFETGSRFFSINSIRKEGFTSELFDLGFSDWFYGNLLLSDERFSFARIYGNVILLKSNEEITVRSFLTELIREHGSIDAYDLTDELADKYGCINAERSNCIYKVQGAEVYYDRILDRFYANKDLYYQEVEMEF